MRHLLNSFRCLSRLNYEGRFIPGSFVLPTAKFGTSIPWFAKIDIKTPRFPESISEGDISWLKKTGDTVSVDEAIGEIETDETSIPILSTQDGTISKMYVEDGSKVKPNQLLCVLDTELKADSAPNKADTTVVTKGSIEYVRTPGFPESISEGDVRWKIKIGDVVEADALIGEIETDKTSIEVRSPFSGVVTTIEIEDGKKVKKGDKLLQLERKDVPKTTVIEKPRQQVIEPPKKKAVAEIKKVETTPTKLFNLEDRTDTRVKMTRMRQTVAHRLKNAQNTLAMLTTFNEADMSNLMEMRKRFQDEFVKRNGIKLGFMSTFIAAACHALKTVPAVNAYIDGEDIVFHNYTDISVAVATPKGLVVPVIRDADKLSFAELEKSLASLAEKGRTNKLSIEDMEGGNFTITNGGVFGSLISTPIINPPQSAILGLHAINERPVAVACNVVIRPMMYIALTYDHRLVDGREAVTFLKKIKECVEDPQRLLLDL